MMMPMTYAEAADILDTAKCRCVLPWSGVVNASFQVEADLTNETEAELRLADAIDAAIHALRRCWDNAAGDRARVAEGQAR
jgi:hypothetical protein